MSKRAEGYYWVLYWANEAHQLEVAHWTGSDWELIGEASEIPHDDGAFAWIGERIEQPVIDIANLPAEGNS